MFRSIQWYTKFVVTLIGKTPLLKKAEKIKAESGQKAFDDYCFSVVKPWALMLVEKSGADIVVHNMERIPKDSNVLFVSNHQSDFDIAAILALIDKNVGFVAKIEMLKIPLLHKWMENIHCLFMDRNDLRQSAKIILDGIALLKSGYSLVVFPEGTRSKSDSIGEFKAGSFKLATKSGVPIVPVTISGTYKILEGNGWKICPAHVDIYIHEAIYTAGMDKTEQNALCDNVYAIIKSKLSNNETARSEENE